MRQFQRPRLFLTTLLLVFSLGIAGSSLSAEQAKNAPAKTKSSTGAIVAKVNGVSISQKEVDRETTILLAQNGIQKPAPADTMKKAEATVVQHLIDSELLYQAGRKTEIKDLDKLVMDRMANNKAQFATSAEFNKVLKDAGLTEKDLKLLVRKGIIINAHLDKEVADKAKVTETESKAFYDANPEQFKTGEKVRASHILIKVDAKATPEEKQKARDKATAIRKQLSKGEDFAALAQKESSCPSSAKGGDLGYFQKGRMVPEFDQAAFALKPGELSEVVETQFGFHVIKVTEKKPAGTIPFNEAQNDIVEYLRMQKIQKGMKDYVEKLRQGAKIEMVKK